MVTEADAAAEGNSAAAEDREDQQAQQPTVEELQKRLDQAEQRARSAEGRLKSQERASVISGEAIADVEERLRTTTIQAIREAFEIDDPVERNRRLGEIEAQQKAEAALAKRITDAQPRLDRLVEESGKDISDPMFAETNAAWEAGRPEEAIALARIAVTEARTGNTYSKEEIEEIVEARLKNERAASARVDTGASTASTGTPQTPRTAAELNAYLRQRRLAGNPVPASEHKALIDGLQG